MRTRRPDFGAVDPEAARYRLGARAHRSEIGTRVRLAHPDREITLAPGDARQDGLTLLLTAEAQEQRARLAVGHPVRAGRRAVAQKLFGDDKAVEETALAAAIFPGPGDADPALAAQRL